MSIIEQTDALVAEHGAWLRRLVRRRMADPALVDDVVQEVLLRVCRASPPEDPRELRPWLATVAFRTCADVWRAQPPRAATLDPVQDGLPAPGAVVPGSDDHLAAVAHRAGINDALVRLPERHRRLFEKQALLGLTYEEIADEENVSIACVTSALGRARAGFRRRYEAPVGIAVLYRLRARLQGLLGGHVEWAMASVALATTAVLVVGPDRSVASVVAASPVAATAEAGKRPSVPTPPAVGRDEAPPARRQPAAVAVSPAVAGDPAPGRRPVGEVAMEAPQVELAPDRWRVGYTVEVGGPHGDMRVRSTTTIYCENSMVGAAVCPLAAEMPGAQSSR